MASAFPKLPGFVPTQEIEKPNFRKVSALKQEANREVKSLPNKEYPVPRRQIPAVPTQEGMFHPDYMSTTHAMHLPKNVSNDSEELYQPTWVKMDRHVLRFSGFFKEAVVESALENFRVRKVTILYYLEDHSISITEPKQENSGIPQGAFLKRQKVLNSNGSGRFIVPEDFRLNEDITIFGKTIRLNDCDEYTREFYEGLHLNQPQAFIAATDNWEVKTQTKFVPQKDTVMKDYLEHKLGGGRVTSQKQFLENDRKVLKFYVFSEITYILHYYLADDTIEIKEINVPNSGRDPFAMMLRRQKMPRKFSLNQPGQTYAEDFIRPQDIQFGQPLIIYNRKFMINGCDPFTRQYYAEKFNVDFPLGGQELPPPREQNNIIIPPHNGIGDEQDSLGYIYRLQPKPPKKDFFKWVDNQVNLRFLAMFNTDKPEDKDRVFIITFFLNDDSLLVYEPVVRNSGIINLNQVSPMANSQKRENIRTFSMEMSSSLLRTQLSEITSQSMDGHSEYSNAMISPRSGMPSNIIEITQNINMGNNTCGERTRMESMNAFITDENLELKEQDNIVSQVTDKIFKVNLAKNELYERIQSIDSETVQYLTEFICQLNRFSTKKLEDILTTTQSNYKIIVQSILKCRPVVKQVSLLHETTNNLKLLHDLQKQKYEQLYHRPCYDNLYNLIREVKIKKYGQYVIKEDTSVDCELATKRMTAWLNLSTKNHPNVLNLRACKITDRACYYLTDFIKGLTLDQVNIMNIDEKISVAQQMIESVRFMHHHGLIHGDIKLSNFMYANHVIILMDLDQMGSDKTDMTYLYSLKDSEYPSFNGDVYALGLCLYQIFSNQKIVKDFTFEMYKMRDQLNYGKIEEILKSSIQYRPKDITYLHYLCKFL